MESEGDINLGAAYLHLVNLNSLMWKTSGHFLLVNKRTPCHYLRALRVYKENTVVIMNIEQRLLICLIVMMYEYFIRFSLFNIIWGFFVLSTILYLVEILLPNRIVAKC